MTQQEQQMIAGLIQRVQNTPLSDKDPEAEQYLQQSLGRNPDALYILSQTVLVQSYALEQAQKQLADLKAQAQQTQQPQKHTSFLGSIFGSGEPDRSAPPPPQQAGYTPVPIYGQPVPAYAQPAYQQAPPPGGGGGFLRGAMQTAAGVAAGAVAFEGIESLMHGFGGHSGGSSFGSFGGDAPREEIVNNYYGDHAPGANEHSEHGFQGNDDIEDRRDDSNPQSNFADTSSDDDASADDLTSDDGSSDDSGGDDGSDSDFS